MTSNGMNKEDVLKLAKLARIEMTDTEAENMTREFGSILRYVGEVKEVEKLKDSEVEFSRSDLKNAKGQTFNTMREDAEPHESGVYTEDLLASAPEREKNYVKVKKIL